MSETDVTRTDFDRWVAEEYAAGDERGFTAFVILVKIKKKDVEPMCSTYMHVIGDEVDWGEVTTLFAGSGMRWDAVVFFAKRDFRHKGPLDNPAARIFLLEQETKIAEDRLAINQGHFFDAWGRRMRIDEGRELMELSLGQDAATRNAALALASDVGLPGDLASRLLTTGLPFRARPFRASTPSFRRFDSDELGACRSGAFPAFSITGGVCALNCKHCRAEILKPMIPTGGPELFEAKVRGMIARQGLRGFLLSGGSNRDNEVPFDRYLPAIRRLKDDHPALEVLAHTALVDRARAEALKAAGIDVAMLDIIGDADTIRDVYHLDKPVSAFETALENLVAAGLTVVPHIVIGLHFGTIRGEHVALDIIARHQTAAAILVVLMPAFATPGFGTVDPLAVASLFGDARERLSDRMLLLGCARPPGTARPLMDVAATLAGFDGIAYPADEAIQTARLLNRPQEHVPCLLRHAELRERRLMACLPPAPPETLIPRKPEPVPSALRNGGAVKLEPVEPAGLYRPRYRRTPAMRSPHYVQLSTAAAITLGLVPGKLHRCACTRCLNLLLTYPEGCRANCAYCGLARHREAATNYADRNFIRVDWPAAPLSEIIARVADAGEATPFHRMCISMITHPSSDADTVSVLEQWMAAIPRAQVPVSILSNPTTMTRGDVQTLFDLGADIFTVALDACTPALFERTRGKGVDSPHSWKKYWSVFEHAREIFGRQRVGMHLIVGLGESDRDVLEICRDLHAVGGHSHLFCFFPERGSLMDHLPAPPRARWRRLQLARYLLEYRDHPYEALRFSPEGELLDFGMAEGSLQPIVATGVPFRTSGCPGKERPDVSACDRPYGDSPPSDIASYPFQPNGNDLRSIRRQLATGPA